ncbi:MAG: hypothetical protein ACLS6Y_09240 [Streptococcus salivarius]
MTKQGAGIHRKYKDGMEVFGLIGCDDLEDLTDAQRAFVQSDEAMQFKSN